MNAYDHFPNLIFILTTLSETNAYGEEVWKIRVYHVYVYKGVVHR